MSLFSPEDHPNNPPETWQVRQVTPRLWHLTDKDGRGVLDSRTTKREAEALKVSGWLVNLYEKEGRWYAGEAVAGWRPFASTALVSR